MVVAMNKSVFISYSSKDERYIKKMTQMLEKMGITYWIQLCKGNPVCDPEL